jgi:hypothetical protein
MQVLPKGVKPSLYNSKVPFRSVHFGVMPWMGTQGIQAYFIDQNLKPISQPNDDQMEDLRLGRMYLVAFGHAEYSDLIGLPHWQYFCNDFDMSYRHSTLPVDPSIPHEDCGKYNRTDNNLVYSIPSQISAQGTPSGVEEIKCAVPKN